MDKLSLKYLFILILLPLFCLFTQPAVMAKTSASEEQIKAAFIFRFLQYTKWPEPLGRKFYLGVYGDGEIAKAIKTYAGRTIKGSILEIIHLPDDIDGIKKYNAIFITSRKRSLLQEIQLQNANLPVLLISDVPGALEENIDIALVTEPNKISFGINLTQAQVRDFSFSGQMLKLAQRIL